MTTDLITTIQNAKLALAKSKSLLDIIKNVALNRNEILEHFENFKLSISIENSIQISSASISPDGKNIIFFCSNGFINILNICSGKVVKSFDTYCNTIDVIALTPDGKYILSCGSNIILWDIRSGKQIRHYGEQKQNINSIAITSDGKYFVTAGQRSKMKLWDINSGNEIRSFGGHRHGINSVVISQNGEILVSSGRDNTIKVWKMSSGKMIRNFEGHQHGVFSTAITANGHRFISSTPDKTMVLRELKSGNVIQSYEGHKYSSNSTYITSDDKYAITCSKYDNEIKIWEIESGKNTRIIKDYHHNFKTFVISPNEKYIATVSQDNIIKLWDINIGKLLCSYLLFNNNEWLSWTPSSDYNSSKGAYDYFFFIDDSRIDLPKVISADHPIYKAKKKEILLSDYIGGTNAYTKNTSLQTYISEFTSAHTKTLKEFDDEDEIPF